MKSGAADLVENKHPARAIHHQAISSILFNVKGGFDLPTAPPVSVLAAVRSQTSRHSAALSRTQPPPAAPIQEPCRLRGSPTSTAPPATHRSSWRCGARPTAAEIEQQRRGGIGRREEAITSTCTLSSLLSFLSSLLPLVPHTAERCSPRAIVFPASSAPPSTPQAAGVTDDGRVFERCVKLALPMRSAVSFSGSLLDSLPGRSPPTCASSPL